MMKRDLKYQVESKSGMTMIEIIVVLTILAILAAVTVPSLMGFIVNADEKDCTARRSDIKKSYTQYLVDNGYQSPSNTVVENAIESVLEKKASGTTSITGSDGKSYTGYQGICEKGGVYYYRMEGSGTAQKIVLTCSLHGETTIVEGTAPSSTPSTTPETTPEQVQLNSISVTTLPTKTTYFTSEEFSAAGGYITAFYSNNTTKKFSLSESDITCTGFTKGVAGTQTITATYQGKTATFDVIVNKPKLTGFEITTLPNKIIYTKNDNLDVTGGKVKIFYEDGTSDDNVVIDPAWCSPTTLTTVGDNIVITVTYPGLEATQSFNVKVADNKKVTGFIIVKNPSGEELSTGSNGEYIDACDQFSSFDYKVKYSAVAQYSDGTTGIIDWNDSHLNVYNGDVNTSQVEERRIEFYYHTDGYVYQYWKYVNVSVKAPTITFEGVKTEYYIGDTLEKSGYIVLTYQSGAIEKIGLSDSHISGPWGFDSTKENNKETLSMNYTDNVTGKNIYGISYEIKILDKRIGLEITPPKKLKYYVGDDTIDLTGGKAIRTYKSGKTNDTFDLDTSNTKGFDTSEPGINTLTVTDPDGSGFSGAFQITVLALKVKKIEFLDDKHMPTSYFTKNEAFNVNGGVLKVTYNNGTSKNVDMTTDMIVTKPDMSKAGSYKLYVAYGDATQISYNITIAESLPDPSDIFWMGLYPAPDKTDYYVGDDLSVEGGEVHIWYYGFRFKTIPLTKAMCSGYDMSKAGTQTVTVHINGSSTSFPYWCYDSYNINVKKADALSIAIKTKPTEVFLQGQNFNIDNGQLLVTMNNGDTKTVDMTKDMCSGYDMSKPSVQTVKVRYLGAETSYKILVAATSTNPGTTGTSAQNILEQLVVYNNPDANTAYKYYKDNNNKRDKGNVPLDSTGTNFGQVVTKIHLLSNGMTLDEFNSQYAWVVMPNTSLGKFDANATVTNAEKYKYSIFWMNEGISANNDTTIRHQVYVYNTYDGSKETGTVKLKTKVIDGGKPTEAKVTVMDLTTYEKLDI